MKSTLMKSRAGLKLWKNNIYKVKKVNKRFRNGLKPHLCGLMGFTLIEVVISLAIIGISIVAILQLFSGGLRSIKVSDDYLRATVLARNKMSELESKFNIFTDQEGVFEQDDRYHWSLSVENYNLAKLHPQFENLKYEDNKNIIFVDKITLKVFWDTEHGRREMELVTLKTSAMVSPSTKDIILGKYPLSLIDPRGEQFGGQGIPGGQSESDYVKIESISGGSTKIINRQIICGAKVNVKVCGSVSSVPELIGHN